MKISIIIPAYNEAQHIKACLKSLANQTLKPQQVIVIDDGSTDKTLRILSGLKIDNLKLKVLKQQHQGAATARNYGASQATGQILVFVDADMEFDPGFIAKLTEPIRKKKSKGTFSKDEIIKNWPNPWAKAWNYNLGIKTNHGIPENYPDQAPVFRAILKSEFDKVSGFDTSRGYDDDWTLSEKLGYQATLAPQAIYYHHNPDSLPEIFHQARWQGTRRYKLGACGKIFALTKTCLSTFLLIGPLVQALRYRHPPSFCFKIVYNLGLIQGLINSLISKRISK
jgi:glycosyltransferase involved in cell wall biosynthesis